MVSRGLGFKWDRANGLAPTNSYFKLKLEFPDNWRARSSTENLEAKIQYQLRDDDLPTKEDDFRTLVNSMRYERGKHRLIGSQFFIGIHKKSGRYELSESKPYTEGILERTYGTENLLGHNAQTMKIVEQGENYLWVTKAFCYEIEPTIWLTIAVSGDCPESFEEAENLLDLLKVL